MEPIVLPETYLLQTEYERYIGVIAAGEYSNHRLALLFINPEAHDDIYFVLTINVVAYELGQDEIFVKNYSGHEMIPDWLVQHDIATYTGRTVSSGHVEIPSMILTESFKNKLKEAHYGS